jgi:mono/diheme cytochrome c family protein
VKREAVLSALLLLTGCNEGLDPQKRFDTLSAANPPWRSTGEALSPPDGVVAQGDLDRDQAVRIPPPITDALVARGQERFGIYCSPCHGFDGYADGIVVSRGFPRPPSFHQPRLIGVPRQLFFDTISNGYGAMYSYRDRIAPQDRWAIVAYIRALQLSQLLAQRGP